MLKGTAGVIAMALALGACTQEPMSDKAAARAAAKCFGWPSGVLDKVSKLEPAGPVPGGDAIMFAYEHAVTVAVSPKGECSDVMPTRFFTNQMRHLPVHSFTTVTGQGSDDGKYVLILYDVDPDHGHVFVGMRGDDSDVATVTPGAPI